MTVDRLLDQVEDMSDLELAVLLSLITKEHCVIEADEISLDDLARELRIVGELRMANQYPADPQQITADGFGLSSVTIDCSDTVNLTDFAESILVDAVSDSSRTSSTDGGSSPGEYAPRSTVDHVQFGSKRLSSGQAHRGLDIRKVANVVFLQNLDLAPEAVQVQVNSKEKNIRSNCGSHCPRHIPFYAFGVEFKKGESAKSAEQAP
ncbi:hypothetical protein UCRPC4_g03833 [Phaeomoniella chlamydospora]|uniref:Uncharacterized protein n=1 Tax=Phaeomoniella chlamydospora TaxID=158046 RepID=A0A0G2EE08_PHACM|nr:hypothetical protein UCRPC4_g03833 [Phaeomoniella chlamydospora]